MKLRKSESTLNGGWIKTRKKIIAGVADIYDRLDVQISKSPNLAGLCQACGKCCYFDGPAPAIERGFDHRLYVTTPELIYLAENIGNENLKPMPTHTCPYQIDGKCSVYEYRFAGCRIFCCKGDVEFQSRLSESVLKKLKSICNNLGLAYRYTDLATALNDIVHV
jgi:hypothetical protein